MTSLVDRVAPLVSRHPATWDHARRLGPAETSDVVTERRVRPFDGVDLTTGDLGPGGAFTSGRLRVRGVAIESLLGASDRPATRGDDDGAQP